MSDNDSKSDNSANGLGNLLKALRSTPSSSLSLGDSLAPPGGLITLASLLSYSKMPEAKDVWYDRQRIILDGFKFVHCRFDKCHLSLSTANFVLDHCIIDEETVIEYGGDIMKIVQLFTSRYQWAYEHMPGLAPTRHEDGTISIGG